MLIKKSARQSRPQPKSRMVLGFTLIELLLVVALISLLSMFAVPTVLSIFNVSLKTVSREMAVLFKETFHAAVLTGRVHRVVYDLTEGKYWVESGPTQFLLDTAETLERERERQKRKGGKPKEGEGSETSAVGGASFALETMVTRTKRPLPTGVFFESIETERDRDGPLTDGLATTHFFPNGLTEQTLVHLKDARDRQVTLAISSLMGQTYLYDSYVEKRDAFAKP